MGTKTVFVGAFVVAAATMSFALQQDSQTSQGSSLSNGGGSKKTDNVQWESPKRKDKVVLTEAEWKKKLTPEQYKILRASGTEAAFCGKFHDNHLTGTYLCAGCGLALFASKDKFDSGSGWPSFFRPVSMENVWFKRDNGYGMQRVEVLCARCDGHLGHVFDDAPQTPTGLRYCINSDGLTFKKELKEDK